MTANSETSEIRPEQFPMLRALCRNPSVFDSAIDDISGGLVHGSIRNVTLNEAKFTLSRLVDDLWEAQISEPFFYGGKYQKRSEEVNALHDDIMIMGLHDVIGASKKIAKSTSKDPVVDAMRAYFKEVLPLSMAVASLKDKVVKGRAPNTAPAKPENPNKVVRTCAVCFRAIAVLGGKEGTMAHHGFTRPGTGWQTSSCPGIRFQALEVSSAGLQWLIGQLKAQLENTQAAHRGRNKLKSLMVTKNRTLVTVTPESPDWKRHFESAVASWESEIRSLQREIPALEKKLSDWTPKE
jgi:hypothetical protein